jgi:hypothetical protein
LKEVLAGFSTDKFASILLRALRAGLQFDEKGSE